MSQLPVNPVPGIFVAKKDEHSKQEDLGKISLRDEAEESVMDDDEVSKSRSTGKNGPEDTTPDATDDTSSDEDEDDDHDNNDEGTLMLQKPSWNSCFRNFTFYAFTEEEADEDGNVKEEKKPRAPKKISDVEQGRTLFVR